MRKSGVLMHLSSLPSPYGIGTMGKCAKDFVDFLKESDQSCWQLLPICPTGYGDSPYQSYSTYAGNPYFIDLDELCSMGLLCEDDYKNIDWECSADRVNFGAMYEKRYPILRKAVSKFLENPCEDYYSFCEENKFWLADYALFMALKDVHDGVAWLEWPEEYRNIEPHTIEEAMNKYSQEISFWSGIQYLFYKQWTSLKAYANTQGIEIIGDLPIYVSLDSVDVWRSPELFQLNENKIPKEVAGCPPDGFSEDGQLWGNPLYDWEYMDKTNYEWWVRRIQYLCKQFDVLRIDHFRGFDTYYAIPYGDLTAKNGYWKQGPGMKLFNAVENSIGKQNIIAEDLGYLTDSVKQLLADSGFPGMKVMEFAFDSRDASSSEYIPYNYVKNCVAYTGTHDNDTIIGWFENVCPEDAEYAREYLGIKEGDALNWSMMNRLWDSVADLTIVQAQDLLGLGKEARMNVPSTLGTNWCWRALPGAFTDELASLLKKKMALYGRTSK